MAQSNLDDDLGFQLVRAAATVMKRTREALEPLGLRTRTYSVLTLAVSPGSLGQRELAARLLLDPSQIVPIVDELEARGLVARTVDPADRRSRLIVATDEGRAVFRAAHELVKAADPSNGAGIDARTRTQLLSLLHSVADA